MSVKQLVLFFYDAPVYPSGVNAGGGESATLALAKAFRDKGWKVIACAYLPGGDASLDGIEFWDLGSNYSTEKVTVRLNTIGAFHCLSSTTARHFLYLSGHKNCISRVIFNHAPSESAQGFDLASVFTLIDMMLCVSEAQLHKIEPYINTPGKTRVVRNGFDPALFQYAGPEGRDFQHLVFIGRVDIWKGAHLVMEAFPPLKKVFPDLKVSMYGECQNWQPMIDLKSKISASYPDFHFLGKVPQPEIAAKLRTAGLLVFPSTSFESAGLAVLDAQASGCPVLAFDIGGVKEYLFEGECGVLQKEPNVELFIKNISDLLKSPEMLAQYSRNCFLKARKRTWDVVAQEIIDVFTEFDGSAPVSAGRKVLHILFSIPEFYRAVHFHSFPVEQLLEDHLALAEGKILTRMLLDSALSSKVHTPVVFLAKGLQLEKQNKKTEAVESYRQAMSVADPKDWQPFFCATVCLAEAGDLKAAAQYAQEVLNRMPSFPMAEMLHQVITAAEVHKEKS